MRFPLTRPDEKFYISTFRPRCLSVNLGVVRLAVWFPYLFISLSIGRLWGSKCRALQLYLGLKCDGAKTDWINGLLNSTCQVQGPVPSVYVMTYTPKELAACRIHNLDRHSSWSNQGGF